MNNEGVEMDRFECGTEAATPMSGSLELCVDSDWAQMGRVNEDIYRFLVSCKLSEELAARYTMVACELTENGIKYGNPDKSPGGVHVRIRLEGGEIYLEVSSAVGDESKPFLVELDRTIQWARGFQDPFEAYIARLRAISQQYLQPTGPIGSRSRWRHQSFAQRAKEHQVAVRYQIS